MEGETPTSNGSHVEKECREEAVVNQSTREVNLGDIIWVRLSGSSWWPAQVVDENTVNRRSKPQNRSGGPILVRLYGSYKYLYVDPDKFRLEFENILEENSGSYSEILKKSLEQDLRGLKSRGSQGRASKSRAEGVKSSKRKQDGVHKPNSPSSATPSSARRMKVMQTLGLVAPSGSPFKRNGRISLRPILSD